MTTQRPAGITILAIVFLILALLSLAWSTLVFGFGATTSVFGAIFGDQAMTAVGGSQTVNGILGIVGAVIDLIVAFGLFALKRWAWLLALLGVAITFITGIMGLFSGGLIAFCCGVLGLIVPGAIIYYLLQPDVRRVFGR